MQYFEMVGAGPSTRRAGGRAREPDKAPWDVSPETMGRFAPGMYDPDEDVWELYYLPDDFSQAKNLAADHPRKVQELKELWSERGRAQPGAAVAWRAWP